jgi:hypothetical protein
MKPPPFSELTICGLEELDDLSAQGVTHVLSILVARVTRTEGIASRA